ncbi:putative glycoside hydrolase [Bacillus fonticola]|uniref:putative glycoside hydrolase n=1 Tax=Bacillus fonticola TaxID=2728853 RepID=UPI001472BEB8|nr:putative glycoside hydrolase [Bacillus fonticola]
MNWKSLLCAGIASIALLGSMSLQGRAEENQEVSIHQTKEWQGQLKELPKAPPRFVYDSGLNFKYPDAVRGVYVTGYSAGGSRYEQLTRLMAETDLNAMVIDIKDDLGNVTYVPEEDSPYYRIGKPYIQDPRALLEDMEEKQIYPIARIVVFKDSVVSKQTPDWSFKENGEVWTNGGGDSFVNPFVKEVWEYNVGIAIEAAKLGFQEIQFDYVRFPEGFETRDEILEYSRGEYDSIEGTNVDRRVQAVTDFVAYAKEQLEPYDVDVSVDIFGYTATIPEAPGIGQNFSEISANVDVISSMIYPSHWTSYFGITKPDLQPYDTINEYAKVENAKLAELENAPTSRPWLQDFTASWLGSGNYLPYGVTEIEAQIRALQDNGINEFLLWDAGNSYTEGVDYTP